MIKRIIIFLLIFIVGDSFAQSIMNDIDTLDVSIDNIWAGSRSHPYSFQDIGPEVLGKEKTLIAPILAPARSRIKIPGTEAILLPVDATEGPLNLSLNDTKAYIIYNRATIAQHKQQYQKARELYRELVRQFPDSSYTPYALYTLSISEKDYRRKIRLLLTIKERFPEFDHMSIILDRLGDIYYLLDSSIAADEVFSESDSSHALYMRAVIALDAQRPSRSIFYIRSLLKNLSNNELAYETYILYAEALILLKQYKYALKVLQKAILLRPWAYDNGALILLNGGKAFFYDKQLKEALYAFSLLRLRFSRSSESRLADQYIVALSQANVVDMQTVPWLAESFETLIKEQPFVNLIPPTYPTKSDMLEMRNLPSAVNAPTLNDVTYVREMPKPIPRYTQSVLVPIDENTPQTQVDLITFTNTIIQQITNITYQIETNKVFIIETNTITNDFIAVDTAFLTNMVVLTNIAKVWETNTVVSYEPVVIWKTNYRDMNVTNFVTNIVDYVVTNEKVELLPLWKTNYNLVDRDNQITNVIYRIITNKFLEIQMDNTSNWMSEVITNKFLEIIPPWKTTYRVLDSDMVTNIIQDIKTNTHLEVVPQSKGKMQIDDTYKVINTVITNTKLRVAPYWVTNIEIIQTNLSDIIITNLIPTIKDITNTILVPSTFCSNAAEIAPIEIKDHYLSGDLPEEYISETIYDQPYQEDQKISMTSDVMHLEDQVARFAEKAAGVVGKYSIPDNKGYIVRIAQVRDLSVANIIMQDIYQLNRGFSIGIYYRDELYYIEIRNIRHYDSAKNISQELYENGYTDLQVFEQFEITEYE